LGGEAIDSLLELMASIKSAQGAGPREHQAAKKIALGRAMNGSN